MISATTLFALSSSASCALLQLPVADAGLNQLLSLAFGDTTGHEHVLWQGEIFGALNKLHHHCKKRARLDCLCRAGALYIPGVDCDVDCVRERACKWSRFAAVVRSTCTGVEKTTLRVLCTSTAFSLCNQSSSQASASPHCVNIVISPQPAAAPLSIELCVRWVALVIRESRASNASCLGLLLRYISSMICLTKSSMVNRLQPSRAASDIHRVPHTDVGSAAMLASRCGSIM